MAERLNEAEINEPENNEAEINEPEINEDVTSLHEENEYNLDTATVKNCFNWTPLHVAASRGQQELFQALLNSNPEVAEARDSQQRSLLHLASANGHIEIVRILTKARPEMCLARDQDGANPLHVAAMRGKVDVLDELFQANPHAARAYRVDRGERETILHLCVKYNQLQFLSMLEKYFKGKEFVNITDNADNTILHLAVADRRYEIIKHILGYTEIDVNATNASKQTEMDILLLGQEKGAKPEGVDKDIKALLKNYHAKRGEDDILNPTQKAERKNGIIVAAVLMATLFFQAGVAPPGGVWQDNKDGHTSGEAVMASNHPTLYWYFLYFNMAGFIASLSTVVFIMVDLLFKSETYALFTYWAMGATITSIAATYWISLTVVSKDERTTNPTPKSTMYVLIPWFVLLAAFLLWRKIARIVGDKKRRNRARFDRLSHANNQASVNEANV